MRAVAVLGDRMGIFVREHAVFLALIAAYFAGAAIFFAVLGRWDQWYLRLPYPLWMLIVITFSAARLVASRLRHRANSALWRVESLLGAVLVIAIIVPFQTTFSSVKRTIDDLTGFPWDWRLAEVDRVLHGGRHPWEWFEWMVRDPTLMRWIDSMYLWWFPLVTLFLLWAAWTPHRILRQQALVSVVLIWVLCGNVAAFALASAGPCYFRYVEPTRADPYERLIGTLDGHARRGMYVQARLIQTQLWEMAIDSPLVPFRGISAMPSVHVAMAVLFALVGWTRHRAVGIVAAAYALVIMVGSVVLGWHYAIDGYVGGLMAYGIWRISARLVGARAQLPAPSAS
jgi:membrane-associated phospholipid phosphatase